MAIDKEIEYKEQEHLSIDPTQGCQLIGAFRAFHCIKDGYVLLHSPPGCHSGMHPRDSIYGAEHKALTAVKRVSETFNPSLFQWCGIPQEYVARLRERLRDLTVLHRCYQWSNRMRNMVV